MYLSIVPSIVIIIVHLFPVSLDAMIILFSLFNYYYINTFYDIYTTWSFFKSHDYVFQKKINLQQKVIKLKLNPYILHQKIISTNKITTGYCLPSDDLPHPIILVYYISTHQCIVYLSQLVILYISLSSFYKTLHLQIPYQI